MKLGTPSSNALGQTALDGGMPGVITTNPNRLFAKLIVKSELGQIVQQWLILQNKCTLGSASSCALRCQLSGIAPYHALLVMGSRQIFIRALAPKLARNGVMVNELLLTEDQSTFEIAGHQFELIRNHKTTQPTSAEPSAGRQLKFTLARPLALKQNCQPTVVSSATAKLFPAMETMPSTALPSATMQSKWIVDLIQSAMQPLERQLHDMLEPLAAVQSEFEKRGKRQRNQRSQPAKSGAVPTAAVNSDVDLPPQIRSIQATHSPLLSPALESQLVKQNESLELLNERLAEMKSNLLSLERVVAERNAVVLEPVSEARVAGPSSSPVLENQLTRQSETLGMLNARLTEVTHHLGSLERLISQNLAMAIEAAATPPPTPEPVHETLRQITSVADQLLGFAEKLEAVKSNLSSLELMVADNLKSTNELKLAAIDTTALRALPSPKTVVTLAPKPKGTCPTSANLLASGNLNGLAAHQPLETRPTALQPEIEQAAASPVTKRIAEQIAEPTRVTPRKAVEQASAPSLMAGCVVDEYVDGLPSPLVQPAHSDWEFTPQAATEGPAAESATASDQFVDEQVDHIPQDTFPETPEVTSVESPLVNQANAGGLPSWWTEDDKTQYNDDSIASASIPSPWNVAAAADETPATELPTAPATSLPRQVAQEPLAVANVEPRDRVPASAWDVEPESTTEFPIQQQPAVNPIFNISPGIANSEPASSTTANSVLNNPVLNSPVLNSPVPTLPDSRVDDSLFTDESQELSSLLERFGIAREPVTNETAINFDARTMTSESEATDYTLELPNQDFAAFVNQPEMVAENLGPALVDEPAASESEATLVQPESEAVEEAADGGEESIEDYMKRLMARMRGGSVEEPVKPSVTAVPSPPSHRPRSDSLSTSSSKIALPSAVTEKANNNTTSPFNPEEYVPKALAPEKTRNLAAMRELANTSARSAIQVSARRRYGTAIAIKLAIALTGLGVGATLVMINGLNVNVGLIATVASFLVAVIWGFDAVSTLKPLLYSAGETIDKAPLPPELEA